MIDPADRVPIDACGASLAGMPDGAVPYGGGIGAAGVPLNAPRGAVPYISDTPPPTVAYRDRPTCIGRRRDGEPCNAKASPDRTTCDWHRDQA